MMFTCAVYAEDTFACALRAENYAYTESYSYMTGFVPSAYKSSRCLKALSCPLLNVVSLSPNSASLSSLKRYVRVQSAPYSSLSV